MSLSVEAIYENGVFKPLEKIDLKEKEKVIIDINLKNKLKKRLKSITESIYLRTQKFDSKEIENDITIASNEVNQK